MMTLKTCILCHSSLSGSFLDLGKLPLCNGFVLQTELACSTYSLMLAECPQCSLIQLLDPPPVEELIPRFPWIRYNEPDGHLEAVSLQLQSYLSPLARIYGVGPFDQPLLNQLSAHGYDGEMLDLLSLGSKATIDRYPYLETLQACLQPPLLQELAHRKGQSQLVICRYLLEHCRDPLIALDSLRPLLAENGLALIEVPDSSKFLNNKDYSFIWEEHTCYFTPESLTHLFQRAHYELLSLMKFEGQLEDALVAIVQPLQKAFRKLPFLESKNSSLFSAYRNAFSTIRHAWQENLAAVYARKDKVALFGAGHQAIMFVNTFGLDGLVSYLVDDDIKKQAYFTPGFHLPIVASEKLLADDKIDTCLLAVNPRIENKILEKCQTLLQRGGKIYSIFTGSHLKPSWIGEKMLCSL
ncbi:MAG TPA: class I SAM-dependent methyltransferase [Gammaproteobacteria bacterium]|nr:class I SAM-dependent methyltransferase [Gammaproteobacteria bacterium]